MPVILDFVYVVLNGLLSVLFWTVLIGVAMTWLVAFDIINLRNRAAYNIVRAFDRFISFFLAPFRRFIPPIGGMDVTPVILLILIQAIQHPLLSSLYLWLRGMVGGGVVS